MGPHEHKMPTLEVDLVAARRDGDAGQRVTCGHADHCAGCSLIALPYGEQLALKRGRVVQSVSRYAALELVYTEPVAPAAPIVEYRTRVKLLASTKGRLGLFAKGGGHDVADVPDCRVLSPTLLRVAAVLRARIRADETLGGPLAPFDPDGTGRLRAIDLREVQGCGSHVLVTLVMQRERVSDDAALEAAAHALAAEAPTILGVAVNLHDGESPHPLGTDTVVVYGAASARDHVGQSDHEATYGSFIQAHRGQTARIHATLVELLGIGKPGERPVRVVDLYGGSAALSLGLSPAGADVEVGVRASADDVTAALRRYAQQGATFDAAIVNPPRRGMTPLGRELLARLRLPKIAYVSCDPDTLARDLDHFVRLGYGASPLVPVDMIPLTEEVEIIALLRRIGVPQPTIAYDDDDILIVEKGAHEPATPHADYASSLLERARQLPGASEASVLHDLDIGTSGLVMLAKRPESAARWEGVLGSTLSRKIYVVGVRGVTPIKGAITRDLRQDGQAYAARTRYRRLAVASGHSVLRVIPEQGRAHQIRRHLAAVGHPVLGDDRFGHPPTNRFFEEKNALDRTFLHCVRLEFDHPSTNQRMVVEAPLPGDLRAVLDRTGGPETIRVLDHKNALGQSGLSSLPPSDSPQSRDSVPGGESGIDVTPSRS
jgi:23S rRNA (uracil1939-C5)-methyltransferase